MFLPSTVHGKRYFIRGLSVDATGTIVGLFGRGSVMISGSIPAFKASEPEPRACSSWAFVIDSVSFLSSNVLRSVSSEMC